MKWMMGWMHDTLNYFSKDTIYRKYHQNEITFSLAYMFTENFMLPLSHDEVVYGKKSIIGRMPGDEWQRFANLRVLYGYMFTHPGTKLVFMGNEIAQYEEWDFQSSVPVNYSEFVTLIPEYYIYNSRQKGYIFPKMTTDIPNCETAGTLNAIVGLIATAQVNEVLKIITEVGKPLQNELLIYNSLKNSQLKMQLKPTFLKDKIKKIFDAESYFDASCETQNPNWLIHSFDLKEKLSSESLEIIAVLPNLQLPFQVSQTIPIQDFSIDKIQIDTSKTYIMVCQKGLNSYKATAILKNHFPDLNVFSLEGGIENYH